jgi:phosphate transport system ATP-binding protein
VVTDDRSDPNDPTTIQGDPMTTTYPKPQEETAHAPTREVVTTQVEELSTTAQAIVRLRNVSFYYGKFRAVKDVTFDAPVHQITSLIGPSGSGKSTLLRTINRMNDLIPGTRLEGEILYQDENLYASYVDPVEVRRRIGMVFQKPNPFPKSLYDNVAYGPRVAGLRNKGELDAIIERSLRGAALPSGPTVQT